jgi:hypothetical protein
MMTAVLIAAACVGWSAQASSKTFALKPEPKFLACLAGHNKKPTAVVTVQQVGQVDQLTLTARGLKPNTQFDVFTVQRSNLLANGSVDTNFTNFGLAWYQSDLTSDSVGFATTTLRSIFINEIFGFDPDVGLAPINTFHIGFWFNDPADAAPCGFTGTTPFNGEHTAGPAAVISTPDAVDGIGPLCVGAPANCVH